MKEDINDDTGNQGQAAGEHETDTGIAGSLKKLDGKGLKGRRNRVIPRMKEKICRSRKPGLTKKAGKESFDAVAKELLSNKVIVAHILKACVKELSECTIAEIARKRIDGPIAVDLIAVDREMPDDDSSDGGTRADSKIVGVNTEDVTPSEGSVRFDLLFYVVAGKGKEKRKLIINLEIQSVIDLNYQLMNRVSYYLSRLISRQNRTEFFNAMYDDILKVYSIWVCPVLSGYNYMGRFRFDNYESSGKPSEWMTMPDSKMNAVIINFCNKDPDNCHPVMKLLGALLINDKPLEERKKILQDEFKIPMKKIVKRLEKMDSLGDMYFEAGEKQGLEKGEKLGLEKGEKLGLEKGREEMVVKMLGSIRAIMSTLRCNVQQAFEAMDIPEADRPMYLERLQQS